MTLSITAASKGYGSFKVLHSIDLEVAPGEVHALLGPNGAGKSTLIKCIGGAQQFDSSDVTLDGSVFRPESPSEAIELGVATIHQHLSLIDSLSVSDNVFLGREVTKGPLLNKARQRQETQELLDQFGINVRPSTLVGALPVGVKQLIEIAKAWHSTSIRVLILDEPTSALAEDETLRLFSEIERMKTAGARIIYTTHRLGEIYRIADRVTVIRDGRVALTGTTQDVQPRQIVSAISGKTDMAESFGSTAASRVTDAPVLQIDNLNGPRFHGSKLTVRAGEIVGLYGVLGSGRSSLLETIAGNYGVDSGTVRVENHTVRPGSPKAAISSGIAFVPSDRGRQALWGNLSAGDNMLMASYRDLSKRGLRSPKDEVAAFNHTALQLELQPPDISRPGTAYSGGNQQKLMLGRWLQSEDLKVLILDEPTQGVDVGAREKIYETCFALAERGVAVLFSSSDADEIVKIADRVIIMNDGSQIAEFEGSAITEEALLSSAHELI